ncbi:hypothetical protein, partial [Rhizobium laguerreae]|uniref:hypothetical protein n=1 Tax=Rhizobium laguerreae TaxID=1076926 RepID=UPI001C900F15
RPQTDRTAGPMPLFRKTAVSRNSSPDIFGLVQNSLFNYFILVSIRSGIFRKGETHDGRQIIDF